MGTTNYQSNNPPFNYQQGFIFQNKIEPEFQLQLGSKLYPEIPIRSTNLAFYHLRKALGCEKPNSSYAVNISEKEYRTSKFILGFQLSKEHGIFGGGVSSRSGDILTIKC